MKGFIGPRYRIWNTVTDELVEISAMSLRFVLDKLGWENDRYVCVHLGSKIWLDEIKRYEHPTREDQPRKENVR